MVGFFQIPNYSQKVHKQECKLLINSSISRLIFGLFLLSNNQAIIIIPRLAD